MTRRIAVTLVMLAIMSATELSCSRDSKESKQLEGSSRRAASDVHSAGAAAKEKSAEHLVTFVELGSVRCVPCKMMQPIIRDIEREYAGKVKIVFYDVWTAEGRPYAQRYKIRVIPTQVFLDRDGNEFFRHEGYFPKEEIVKVLEQKGVRR